MIIIEPLTEKTLLAAIQLGQQVFINDDPERITSALTKSLQPDQKEFLKNHGYANIQYWIVRENDQLMGAVGYYLMSEDADEAAWLGWFYVDPEFRGKRIGVQLLETVIDAVKKTGRRYLRLYSSSDDPLEKRAHSLYAQYGFKPFREPGYNVHQKGQVIYLQLDLQPHD